MRKVVRPSAPACVRCGALVLACLALLCAGGRGAGGQARPTDGAAADGTAADARRTVEGTVEGDVGLPLAGADVSLVAVNFHRPFGKHHPLVKTRAAVLAQGTTDGDGRFRFAVRPFVPELEIALEVFARSPGRTVDWAELDPKRDRQSVTLRPGPARPRRGRAVDAQGRPVAGVRLAAASMCKRQADATDTFWQAPDGLRAWPADTRTDADGRFAFDGVPHDADLVVEVRDDDQRYALQRRRLAGGADGDADVGADPGEAVIKLAAPQWADGTVVFRDTGRPAAGALLVISSRLGGGFAGGVEARTDGAGRFRTPLYECDSLDIVVVPPSPDGNYRPLERSIPWPAGTTTQRMTLPLYGEGNEPVDGTTPDGRPGSTIDVEHPPVEVEERRPSEPLTAKLTGTLFLGGSLTPSDAGGAGGAGGRLRGVFAVHPETGKWRLVVKDADQPRVSPDGKRLAYLDAEDQTLRTIALESPTAPKRITAGCVGPAAWTPGSDTLIANAHAPAQRDYHGEEYWGEETEKRRFTADGEQRGAVPVPPLYGVWDASPDGGWVAMHWDTHAYLTGAQLFVARADGSDLRPVARRRSQYYWYPRFSPDGAALLAKHLDPGSGRATVRVLALDGSRERSISIGDNLSPEFACWSPDGAAIAVVAFTAARAACKLLVVNAAGSNFREVTLAGAEDVSVGQVDWTAATWVSQ